MLKGTGSAGYMVLLLLAEVQMRTMGKQPELLILPISHLYSCMNRRE